MVTVTGLSCSLTNEIGKGNKMKIKIEMTLDVDVETIKQLMAKKMLADSDETVQYFVRSHVLSAGLGALEEALYYADLPDAVDVIKTNI
jgi:antitoxin component HigA of HigAB toxin-antitoxin module